MGTLTKIKDILCLSFGSAAGTDEREEYIDAFRRNNFRAVREIIERRPEALHWSDENGATALHWAGSFGRGDMAEWLLEQGAPAGSPQNHGYTPLHYAAGGGAADVIKLLAMRGANLEAVNDVGDTPLLHAVNCGQRNAILMLAGCGANTGAKDSHGKTALDLLGDKMDAEKAAVLRGQIEAIVQARAGASVKKAMDALGQGLPSALKIKKPLKLKNRR